MRAGFAFLSELNSPRMPDPGIIVDFAPSPVAENRLPTGPPSSVPVLRTRGALLAGEDQPSRAQVVDLRRPLVARFAGRFAGGFIRGAAASLRRPARSQITSASLIP